jgi:hypothetical protein
MARPAITPTLQSFQPRSGSKRLRKVNVGPITTVQKEDIPRNLAQPRAENSSDRASFGPLNVLVLVGGRFARRGQPGFSLPVPAPRPLKAPTPRRPRTGSRRTGDSIRKARGAAPRPTPPYVPVPGASSKVSPL